MIWLRLYIITQTWLVLWALGFGLNLALSGDGFNWLVVGGSNLIGLLLGGFLAWLAGHYFKKVPGAILWFWLGSLGLVAFCTAILWWLRVGSNWQFAMIGGAVSSLVVLLVLVMFWLLVGNGGTGIVPVPGPVSSSYQVRSTNWQAASVESYSPPSLLETDEPDEPDITQVRQRLYRDKRQLEKSDLSWLGLPERVASEPQLLASADDSVTLVFQCGSHLGQVTFFVKCGANYPRHAPQAVLMELYNPQRLNGMPETFVYEGHLLQTWDAKNSLETVLQDAFLQIEKSTL